MLLTYELMYGLIVCFENTIVFYVFPKHDDCASNLDYIFISKPP